MVDIESLEKYDNFRGLWACNLLTKDINGMYHKTRTWTVTFIFEGEYVETRNCSSIEEAIEEYLNINFVAWK